MKKLFHALLITICFWVVAFSGPFFLGIWNYFSYYVSGLGYGPGSLMDQVFSLLAQPLSFLMAASIAKSAGKEEHNLCVFANALLGAFLCAVLAFFNYRYDGDSAKMWSMTISCIACIYDVWCMAKGIGKTNGHDQTEAESTVRKKLDSSTLSSKDAWVLAGVMLAIGVAIFAYVAFSGMEEKADAEREAIRQEAYDSGYDAGYDAGQTDAKYTNSPKGHTVRMIARITEVSEGMTPLEAAEIVKKYIESDWSNKPSLEEYQNAIDALVKAGELIGY